MWATPSRSQRPSSVGVRHTPLKREYGPGEAAESVAVRELPTDEDGSATNDGRRLDSAEAVIAFIEERGLAATGRSVRCGRKYASKLIVLVSIGA